MISPLAEERILRAHSPYSIEHMLNPVTPERFFSEFYEKKACKIFRDDPSYYHHLLTLDVINDVLASQTLKFPKVKLVNSALDEPPKADTFTTNGTDIHPGNFLKHYADGCTMVFSALHERVASLGLFCDHMTNFFSHGFQTNIYLTPPNAQGFNPHYDTHDVFILQVAGSKIWRFFDTPVELPLKSQPFELKKVKPGPVSDEFVLRPGDMLYIPRGLMHDAETTGELSMHITAGLLGYTWADLLLEALLHNSMNEVSLRSNLPVGFARSTDAEIEAANSRAKDLLHQLAANIDTRAGMGRFIEKLQSELRPNLPDQFRQILALNNIGPQSRLSRRPEVWYSRVMEEEKHKLNLFGRSIEFPEFAGPAIDYLDQHAEFCVADLPDCMDLDGKVVFVKRLVKEGILVQLL